MLGNASTRSILFVGLMGMVSLWLNARGWTMLASLTYLYSFLLTIYLYVIFVPDGLNGQTLLTYSLANIVLLLGGLLLPEWFIWLNGGLVMAIVLCSWR